MMYACEIVASVVAKKVAEEEAKRQAELARVARAIELFKKDLENIDAYVEKKLIEGDGKACLLIDHSASACDGFWHFAEKDYCYSQSKPYWSNDRKTGDFPLDTYIEYLRDHCFNVEIIKCPFTAYSSTGKSSAEMPGITLKISV